jgi:8-oxo-dGTP pyrophosphatase MutT (NUDIX family)
MRTRREVSAGGVVYRTAPDGAEIVLAARRDRRGRLAWGLPKGLIEQGESPEEAAVREVREEAGLETRIVEPLGEIRYFYVWEGVRVAKLVHVFLMESTGGDVSLHDHEMEEVRWFPAGRAAHRASYPSERELVERAAAHLSG